MKCFTFRTDERDPKKVVVCFRTNSLEVGMSHLERAPRLAMATSDNRKHGRVILATSFHLKLTKHCVGDEQHVVVERRTAQIRPTSDQRRLGET